MRYLALYLPGAVLMVIAFRGAWKEADEADRKERARREVNGE